MAAISLGSLRACFQGLMPSFIATCARDGTPNVTYLSQVYLVDERHVALSCQFFNKTRRNIAENPVASVMVNDPRTLEAYELELGFLHSETSGPLFDEMETRIEAIASLTGMKGVFRLIAADVYEVLAVRPVEGFLSERPAPPTGVDAPAPSLRTELRALSLVTERLRAPRDLEALLSALLDAIRGALGFEHMMVLVPDEKEERLFTVASLGYGGSGVGAEVAIGEGLIGTAAARKRTLYLADLDSDLRYGRAIRRSVMMAGAHAALDPEIPLPGLADAQSQIAIPLVSGDRLFGVLAVESRTRAFDDWHAAFLDIVGNTVATAIENLALRTEGTEGAGVLPRTAAPGAREAVAPPRR
ncbi:MAG TPA: GAF domain-containing protein, partial [Polyangiaceae bacterium]